MPKSLFVTISDKGERGEVCIKGFTLRVKRDWLSHIGFEKKVKGVNEWYR